MEEDRIKPNVGVAGLVVLIVGIILLTSLHRTQPRAMTATQAANQPMPIAPAFIHHTVGATSLNPGLSTNPANDPTPRAFQYATGTDPFNGQTGEGSGPESTQRTAAIRDSRAQSVADKEPQATAAPIPPEHLDAIHAKPASAKS